MPSASMIHCTDTSSVQWISAWLPVRIMTPWPISSFLYASVLGFALSIPLDPPNETQDIILVTAVITTKVDSLETTTVLYPPSPLSTLSGELPSDQLSSATTEILIVTATVTTTPTATITITERPLSPATTEVISAHPSTTQVSSYPSAWTAPPQFTDLSSFRVSHFAYGQGNLQLVSEATTNTTVDPSSSQMSEVAAFGANSTFPQKTQDPHTMIPPSNDPHTLLQVFYPQGSINPDSEPQGGADFYASPLDFSRARTVTLEYSVYFPIGFEWALAGKLPGIYGGHTGCSGGNEAKTCFSTRLMWRKGGKGELYLVSILPSTDIMRW